jgi:hypothetical protein
MKYLILFVALSVSCLSQVKVFNDSLASGEITLTDSTFIVTPDTSHFFDGGSAKTVTEYQVMFNIISQRIDTLVLQEKRMWGRGAYQDSAWVNIKTSVDGGAVDSVIIISGFVTGKTIKSAQVLAWSPFSSRFRLVRKNAKLPGNASHRVYFQIYTRGW